MDSPALLVIQIIFQIILIVISSNILSKKNRGWGYYILAILMPGIGLIVALCLDKLPPKQSVSFEEYNNARVGEHVPSTNGNQGNSSSNFDITRFDISKENTGKRG